MKKYIVGALIVISFLFLINLLMEDKEQGYPYIEVHVDTLRANEYCGSIVDYTIQGEGSSFMGGVEYTLERRRFFGWKDANDDPRVFAAMAQVLPIDSNICTTNVLESGTYRIKTTIRHAGSGNQKEISTTFTIE